MIEAPHIQPTPFYADLGAAEPGVRVDPELRSEIWDRAWGVADRHRWGR